MNEINNEQTPSKSFEKLKTLLMEALVPKRKNKYKIISRDGVFQKIRPILFFLGELTCLILALQGFHGPANIFQFYSGYAFVVGICLVLVALLLKIVNSIDSLEAPRYFIVNKSQKWIHKFSLSGDILIFVLLLWFGWIWCSVAWFSCIVSYLIFTKVCFKTEAEMEADPDRLIEEDIDAAN